MKNFAEEVRRLISESTPDELSISTVRISDIFLSTQKFFNNNFRGAIITEASPELYGYADTSVDGMAYFFKVLLNAVFGDSVVRVSMEKRDSKFFIKTQWRHCRDISASDLAELENIAKLSGFSLDFSSDGEFDRAEISMPVKIMSYFPVYAVSEFKMHTAYVRVFFA